MRVAILSCGPSLTRWAFFDENYDLVIGVNGAVEYAPCDIWCACDHNVFCDYEPKKPFPWGVFTLGKIRYRFQEMDPKREHLITREIPEERYKKLSAARMWNKGDYEFNGFHGFGKSSPDIWKRFTMGSALMLAYMLGASQIDVYGHDMAGEKDWRGEPGRRPSDRDSERWRLEAEMWDLIIGWLEERGVTVERITECRTAPSR